MKHRAWVILAAALAAAGCSEPVPVSELSVIVVTLDTTRADRIGAYGGTVVPTPNLDRVADEGVVFENAVSQVPLTLPAHGSIMTGRYPASHGVRHNGIYRLRGSEITLAERFAEAGFETAAVVGAYVLNAGFGIEQGFSTYDDLPFDSYAGDGLGGLYEAQRTADEVNAAVFDWLDRRGEGRFFLWVHYYDPHDPYDPPEKPGRTLHGSGYDREISYVDACFGDLVERLDRDGVLDRTVLVVVGDHGESLGEHYEKTHGVFLYRGAIDVPFLIRAPGLVPEGRRVSGPVELVDVAPTLMDLLGFAPLTHAQGRSLKPWIEGGSDRVEGLAYAETLFPRIEFGWSELRMVQDERYKYIEAPTPELYDLENDPGEQENLVSNEPRVAADLEARLDRWVAETVDREAAREASRTLSEEEEAKLRALGYLGGEHYREGMGSEGARADPKDAIRGHLRLEEARERLKSGDPAGALALLDPVLEENPRNHLARSTRIEVLTLLDRLEEAEQEAMAAIAAAETDPDASTVLLHRAQRALATVLAKQGRTREAEIAWEMSEKTRASDETAAFLPGPNLASPEGVQEAIEMIDATLAQHPRDGIALSAKFELQLGSGDREGAVETAVRLAEVRAGDGNSLFRAGKLLQEEGRLAPAIECLEAALERTGPQPDVLGHLGTALIGAQRLGEAREVLVTADGLRPQDPRPQFYLGNIALLENREADARRHFDEALARDPDWTEPLDNLALWLLANERTDEAVAVLEDALERNPEDPKARQMLARARQGGAAPA
ncbi:MAG: sulfatase-like hydrolase/transferase, partial [Acidobacteriota bacterium]|nr:sulfatase-like hydrolase/transferase [Acidobacteriota bacterium]